MRSFHPNKVSHIQYKDITVTEPEATPAQTLSQIVGLAAISDFSSPFFPKNRVSASLEGGLATGLLERCRW